MSQTSSYSITDTFLNRQHGLRRVNRRVALRFILITSLLAAATVCGVLSYISLKNTERKVGDETYDSVAASALFAAQSTTLRKVQGSQVMATVLSHWLPRKEQWPFIAMDGYIPIADKVAGLSSSTTQSLMVFVEPEDALRWENHTLAQYQAQQRPVEAGVSEFGFGIWKNDEEGGRVHDISGEVSVVGCQRRVPSMRQHFEYGRPTVPYRTR